MGLLKTILKTKKSGFEDAFFVIAVMLTIAIFILILNKAWGSIRPDLETSIKESLPAGSDVNITKNFDNVTNASRLFDKLFPLVIIGLFAFVFISAYLSINHPIMLIVGIIVFAVALLLSGIYANLYHQISSSEEFTSTNALLPITEIFMKYLPIIILIIFVAITVIIIYSKQGGSTTT